MEKINLEEALIYSKNILDHGSSYKKEYQKCQFYSNERIKNYLFSNIYSKDKALSIIGSGDQILNLICNNVLNIDAFDINYLTYFTFCLKCALIKNCSFTEYNDLMEKKFYLNSPLRFKKILDKIKEDLPTNVYNYYNELINYQKVYRYAGTGLIHLYKDYNIFYNILRNMYASTIKYYEKTRDNLENAKVEFYFYDVNILPMYLNSTYDIILLSNITDYLGNKEKLLKLKEYLELLEKYESLLNKNGVLIHNFVDLKAKYIIGNSHITKDNLNIHNIHYIDNHEGYYLVRKK